MNKMNKLPLARSTDVVVQDFGSELLVYDLKTHKAYNLNETSALVYRACDGKSSFETLKVEHKFTDDLIFLALDELKKENLIEEDNSLISPFTGMSRREAVGKVALGTMIALPLIMSLAAPTAAQSESIVTCSTEGTCICNLPIGSSDSTCSNPILTDCGPGCVCQVSRVGCINQGNGTEDCVGGTCIPAITF